MHLNMLLFLLVFIIILHSGYFIFSSYMKTLNICVMVHLNALFKKI